MGIESLLQQNLQNAGLAGTDRLARNAMFPQSQMDKTQYSVSSQMPTGAETINADYDAPTNAYTGLPTRPFAEGGEVDYNAKAQDLANQVYSMYGKNQNYDETLGQLNAIAEKDPAAFYRARMNLYGKQMGWQTGQNTGDRNAVLQKELETLIPGAKAAGISDEEINSLVGSGSNVGNMENQRRIAEEAAKGKGWVNQNIPGGWGTVAAAAALAAGGAGAAGLFGEGLGGALGAGEGLTTADIMGSTFGGSQFAIDPAAAYAAAGTGAAEGLGGTAAAEGMSLKDAYNAYRYGKMGMNALNAISGAGAPTGGTGGGYGISALPTSAGYAGYAPNTMGGVGLGISNTYNPLVTQPLFLSKLSEFKADQPAELASGGIADLGGYSDGGRLLRGPGDGMSDHIPATIGNKQPARLADGEFVIPADVVSHLGNGSTDAGAKQLYKMMDRIRQARTGNPKQGKQINPNKFLPKG